LIKKMKGKIQWDFDPKVYLESDLSDVVHIYLKNDFSLSVNPRHSSKHSILNIHLNMHILAIHLKISM
jgi:hypothetical protein